MKVPCTGSASFQSTPLRRGATSSCRHLPASDNFNPRPSGEGRLAVHLQDGAYLLFQSTPLRRGATPVAAICSRRSIFQSTPLRRGATEAQVVLQALHVISIHAPQARGDARESGKSGGRGFQSTPLRRGATKLLHLLRLPAGISIHAPQARGDSVEIRDVAKEVISIHAPQARGDPHRHARATRAPYFNPRPSGEGRPLDNVFH